MDRAEVARLAQYNMWQNGLMADALAQLPPDVLTADHGAFFGSILATANHVLWADAMWLSRLSDLPRPKGGIAESLTLTAALPDWHAQRGDLDAQLMAWAEAVAAADLSGDLTWWSGASGAEMRRPAALCIAHMFNHQTHHRGQIHAMVTGAGGTGWVSDLVFMPMD